MKLLDMFEQGMERLMEGSTGALFRQRIQPAEIGKKLERSMIAGQRASLGTSLAPNLFVIGLHPSDYAEVKDFQAGLARQMEAWLAQVATQRNLSFIDRIQVSFSEDDKARRRNPNIVATIADRRGPSVPRSPSRSPGSQAPQATSAFVVEPAGPRLTASLEALDGPQPGRTYIVPPGTTSVGRSPENDVVLNSPDVSRRHARLECAHGGVRVTDLNSTNGTRVDGRPVRVIDVDQDTEISFGGVRLWMSIHREGDRRQ